MQLKNKKRIPKFIAGLIIVILYIFMFIPMDLIIKPTMPKNALDGINVTHLDTVSGTTTFTNQAGDKLEYTYYKDKPDVKNGFATITINDKKYTMSNKDNQIIQNYLSTVLNQIQIFYREQMPK